MCYIYHDRHDYPVYAGWLECLGWRVSSDAGQCCLSYEGLRSLCRIRLSAEAGRRESAFRGFRESAFGGFAKGIIETSLSGTWNKSKQTFRLFLYQRTPSAANASEMAPGDVAPVSGD